MPLKTKALALLFAAALALALFFVLRPSAHGERLRGLPEPVGYWLNQHDDLSNFAAFFVLASLAFRLRRAPPEPVPWFRRHRGTLAIFLLLVLAIEIAQHWIPGRQSDWHDIATGWSGILAAWLLDAWLSARSNRAAKS